MPQLRELLSYRPNELNFGTSGLRGLASDMTDLECYINTAGFLTYLSGQQMLQPGGHVLIGGDLRRSTPHILRAVHRAIADGGFVTEYQGLIPTPALAYYGFTQKAPSIMVTGSSTPADRNGIEFYLPDSEILKEHEAPIKASVTAVRNWLYSQDGTLTPFNNQGMLPQMDLPQEQFEAREAYRFRYLSTFSVQALRGKKIIMHQHSAVGRDLLADLLRALGAEVINVGRSEAFVSVDSENLSAEDRKYFVRLAEQNHGLFAIVSTDGDSDRPLLIDEKGEFHRGDALGTIVAEWCKADYAVYPVTTNDAVDIYLAARNVAYEHTQVGSPYVMSAMNKAIHSGRNRVVGWEPGGGFILGADLAVGGGLLKALPTRDAFLPLIVAMLAAIGQDLSVSELFGRLPRRFTQAGLIGNFPKEISQALLEAFKDDTPENRDELRYYFTDALGFSNITRVDTLDGVRIYFANGDVAHFRPSNNAPQLRIYSVANSQARANEIVARSLNEGGILRQMAANVIRG